jgi:hypothetical protein
MEPHAAGGYDYVLIARGETVTRSFDLLLKDVETALRRLTVFRDAPTSGGPVSAPASQ